MAEKRVRRNKKQLLTGKIEAVDVKIGELNAKIDALLKEKEDYEEQLKELNNAEVKAQKEAEQKEMLSLLKNKGIDLDALKSMLDNK